MDDKIATLTKEVWTQEKSLTDKKARLVALLPYLQAAVEDITEMDKPGYTPCDGPKRGREISRPHHAVGCAAPVLS